MSAELIESEKPPQMLALGEAKDAIARASTIHEAKQYRDQAEAMRVYVAMRGGSLEIQNDGAELRIRAERKIGELLSLAQLRGGDRKSNSHADCLKLDDIGVSQNQSTRWQQIARVPQGEFDQHIRQQREAGKELTSKGIRQLAQRQVVSEPVDLADTFDPDHREIVTDFSQLIGRNFATVYADPPWQYGNQATRASTDNHYSTMTVEQICSMPVVETVAENAHLHLWTTNAFLFDAKRVMDAWGFTYKSVFVWVKPQMGIGNYWRVSHEFMLFGIRGNLPFASRGEMSWAAIPRTKHSAKPREIREKVMKVSPGPYLELFGRSEADGWTVFGNQINRTLFSHGRISAGEHD